MTNFSILMSLYNKENPISLQNCFQSIYGQSEKADEVIIVFDGYINNNLLTVVEKWHSKLNIKIIKLEQNVGLGNALNEGLKYCSNEWIFRMDTDDICLSDRFEKQINFIKANPEVVLLGGQVQEFGSDSSVSLGIKRVPVEHKDILRWAQKRNPFNHMSVAYRKSVILNVGGYQHHLFMEDYNLWLRVLAKGFITHNLADTLLYVRAGSEMLGRRRGIHYIVSEFKLANLKIGLGLQSRVQAYFYFILRSIPRLLPKRLLGIIYSNLRGKH
ncbi:MAG: glycosyltransferase [Staphylococcus xylosus]|nr:glycosyltransferase [Staphylococcus xylosus]